MKILSLLLLPCLLNAKTIKVAVIDTGFDMKYEKEVKLCKSGHKSFVPNRKKIKALNKFDVNLHDEHSHGTHIAGLIAKNNSKLDYCLIIIKYHDINNENNLENTRKSIKWAISQKVDIINYSSAGGDSSVEERKIVSKSLDAGIIFVVAAGNKSMDLDVEKIYPASYDERLIVVGNKTKDGNRAPSSNYGEIVDEIIMGTDVVSINGTMTGTSQSAAIKSGMIIKSLLVETTLISNIPLYIRREGNVGRESSCYKSFPIPYGNICTWIYQPYRFNIERCQ
ncbi:S8 family serine peptidase [Candidatus Pacearchaeota archaeon]|nr:S8 family serine peptidase [Candidatus Pacearchaeota archaeon]